MLSQEYDFAVLRRLVERMSHIDALSRCHSILVLEGNTFEP